MSKRKSIDTCVKVYIPHEDLVWKAAEILSQTSQQGVFEIRTRESPYSDVPPVVKNISFGKNFTKIDCFPRRLDDFPVDGFEDMAALNDLHEASILDNLSLRFKTLHPYTYAGDVCIAINPYQWIEHLYSDESRSRASQLIIIISLSL